MTYDKPGRSGSATFIAAASCLGIGFSIVQRDMTARTGAHLAGFTGRVWSCVVVSTQEDPEQIR
jgi:hypothetical protein